MDGLGELEPALAAPELEERLSEADIRGYFAALWQRTFPGELYVVSNANIDQFTASLLEALAYREPADADASRRLSA